MGNDKEYGYYGETSLRNILPPKNKRLTIIEKQKYGKRIILQNYYGRLKWPFNILCSECRGSHEHFDVIVDIFMVLTNCYISKNPLRIDDHDFYMALRNENIKKKESYTFENKN